LAARPARRARRQPNLRALERLAATLHAAGVRLVVLEAPSHPRSAPREAQPRFDAFRADLGERARRLGFEFVPITRFPPLGSDANNNPVQIVERYFAAALPDRTTTKGYDDFDRETTSIDPFGKTLRYAYDPNGNRIQLTDPDGKVTLYAFDELNRVQTVTNVSGVTLYEYDRSSRITRTRFPNGTAARQFYDAAGRVTLVENSQSAAIVSRFAYAYDRNGNRTEETQTNGAAPETTTYTYDTLDRLETVTYPSGVAGPGSTVTYGYDPAYNRTSEVVVEAGTGTTLSSRTLVYDARNQLSSISDSANPAESATFGYDLNGNQIQKTKAGLTTGYSFDARDRLRRVTQGGSTEAPDRRLALRVAPCARRELPAPPPTASPAIIRACPTSAISPSSSTATTRPPTASSPTASCRARSSTERTCWSSSPRR
jgi:YD repeat-containing protein